MRSHSVLIVGGSLVGLSQALFLARQGVDCVLVERHPGLSIHPRARGLNPRTMELFRQAGIEDRLRATESARALAGNSGVAMVDTLAGQEFTRLEQAYFMDTDTDYSALTPVTWCLCHQDEAEPIIADRARELGADIRFGTELVKFEQGPDGVTAVARDRASGAEETLHAGYLVAADGAHSGIREELGISTRGPGTLSDFLNISFTADLRPVLGERRFVICYVRALPMRAALLPVNNADRWLLHVECDPRRAAAISPAECRALVRAAAGTADLDVVINQAVPWEMAGHIAETFQSGRVFLVGDSAHVMPPTGAFGSNTGVQAAHNLAWKLAAVLRHGASPTLLDSYDAERRPVAARTVEQVVLRSRDRSRMTRAAEQGGEQGGGRTIRPDAELMFAHRYRSSAVVSDTDPATAGDAGSGTAGETGGAGDGGAGVVAGGADAGFGTAGEVGVRAPHLVLTRAGERLAVGELFGDGFVLLAGAAGVTWTEAAAALATESGIPLAAYRVVPAVSGPDDRVDGPGLLADPAGEWERAFGVGPAGAVLVRPDGFVGWRSPAGHPDPHRALGEALSRILHGAPAPFLV
ncbi:FAD-dependent monooxygenase [Streptosporangium sp. CA-135522]|uniref:FAD-dependent monooxygenase n=1 Tax=Streptosporangium sp. CA-135522 TaxID=3240072 RepID=UPI003D8E01EE